MTQPTTIGSPLRCERCGHTWYQRQTKPPSRCPKCTSPYWQKPKKEQS